MGNTGGKDNSSFERAIRARLLNKQAENAKEVKLLLLGTGDSGKTTVAKQFRILYGNGTRAEITQQTLRDARIPCFANIIEGAKCMVLAPKENPALPTINPSLDAAIKTIEEAPENPVQLTKDVANAIAALWQDKSFQQLWDRRSDIQVLDCWGYFASKCQDYPNWGGPDWLPNYDEFLFTRVRTTGVSEECFMIRNVKFKLVDVGGQQSERQKWAKAFEGVNAVIHVAATSEYDQNLYEDERVNRLKESLEVFKGIVNAKPFRRSTVVVFLNKADIFKEKLCDRMIPLNKSGQFPEAPETTDYDAGMQWMQSLFEAQINNFNARRDNIFFHVLTAVKTDLVARVLLNLQEEILSQVFPLNIQDTL